MQSMYEVRQVYTCGNGIPGALWTLGSSSCTMKG